MIANNREKVFEELYASYGRRIQKLCAGYTGDEELGRDLLQETFLRVWQHLDEYRGNASYSTWIYRIAVNTCLGHLRSQKNQRASKLQEHVLNLPAETDNKDHQVKLLYSCIAKLPETERLIIGMVLEDIPYPEIAAATGISDGNLRVKIHRAKQQLSQLYNQQDVD